MRMTGTPGLLASVCLVLASPMPGVANIESTPLDLSAYRGKVVVVDFWASWCVPCRRSFPWLDEMQRKYGDRGLVVIGINEDNSAEDAGEFLQRHPVSFRIISDPDGAWARGFDLIAMPSTYVLGPDGDIAVRHLGFKVAKTSEYEAALVRLLNTVPSAQDRENAD